MGGGGGRYGGVGWGNEARCSVGRTVSPGATPAGVTRPTEMPATGHLTGTPASMSAREVPHTVAMLEEPSEPVTSDVARITYGNSDMLGRTTDTAWCSAKQKAGTQLQ